MTGVLVVVGVLLAALAWFFWPPPSAEGSRDVDPGRRPGVDVAALEQAEREVREATNQDSVRDWGPGTK